MKNQLMDIIHLQGIETTTLLGIYPYEKKNKQPVIIDLRLYSNFNKAAKSDDIQDTYDYANITKFIIAYLNNNKFDLIESLAENLAKILLLEFRIKKLDLKVSKPMALQEISKGALVSVEISRSNDLS